MAPAPRGCASLRKLTACLLLLCLLLPQFCLADGPVPLTGRRFPAVINRIGNPSAGQGFSFAPEAELLEVLFPQIYAADCAVIRCGGEIVMIDCATEKLAVKVVEMCRRYDIDHIGQLFLTHAHPDHIGGLDRLAKAVDIDEVIVCFDLNENNYSKKLAAVCEAHGLAVTTFEDGDEFPVGGARLTFFLKGEAGWSANDRSAVTRLQYGQRSLLFTADIEAKAVARLTEALPPEQLKCDICKYPHHGKARLSQAFYSAADPELWIITANGHESNGKTYLTKQKLPYALTYLGILELRTDGATWLCERISGK